MHIRLLACLIATVLVGTPAFAQSVPSTTSTTTVNPSNSLSVNPTTNQAATTSNVSTQINNENLGANSYGGGISCQSPQIAIGGYGARQSSGVGLDNSDTGFSVQYLAPIGGDAGRTCMNLSHEVLTSHQIDNTSTTIQKCTDFARAGIMLDPRIYPDMARECAGVHVMSYPQMAPPPSPIGARSVNGMASSQ